MTTNKDELCPRCGTVMVKPFVALSREDNKTDICPPCGTTEALEGFQKSLEATKK